MDLYAELEGLQGVGPIEAQGDTLCMDAALETPEVDLEDLVATNIPWNVVVHNDPVNLMSYVTKVFQKVLRFSKERAEKHMMEVHKRGRSIVWSGEREKAEFYVQQLHSHLLMATLEKSV